MVSTSSEMAIPNQEKIRIAAQTIWDYCQLNHDIKKANGIKKLFFLSQFFPRFSHTHAQRSSVKTRPTLFQHHSIQGILVLCSHDIRVADHACDLMKRGYGDWIMFSGGF